MPHRVMEAHRMVSSERSGVNVCSDTLNISIADLVRAAAGGDERAWEIIVARYNRLVWNTVRSYQLTQSEAATVVQTTWLHLVQHLPRIRQPQTLGAWLVTTARRQAWTVLRQKHWHAAG
jgi:DNA-directed RNA polymerase specialized sigma24 family protein